jgi:hypothetical protein
MKDREKTGQYPHFIFFEKEIVSGRAQRHNAVDLRINVIFLTLLHKISTLEELFWNLKFYEFNERAGKPRPYLDI